MKVIGRKVDLFWSTQLPQNRTLTNLKDGGAGFDLRADNVIGYISPNWGPVHLFGAYIADHNVFQTGPAEIAADPDKAFFAGDDNRFDGYSLVGIYDQKNLFGGDDQLFLSFGYEQHNWKKVDLAKDNEKAIRVTGKYSFGNWSIPAFFQRGQDLGGVNDRDRSIYGGGLSYKMGANTLKGAIYAAGNGGVSGDNDTGAILYSFGIDHALQKNIQVYAAAAILANDKNASINLGGSGFGSVVAGVPDKTSWGISFGSRIKF
jgi:predicted porin